MPDLTTGPAREGQATYSVSHRGRYREGEAAAPETAAVPSRLLATLTWTLLALCLGIWAVVGAVLWLPLVVRRVLLFSGALVHGMVVGETPERAGRRLREAADFYRRGFVVAVRAVRRPSGTEDDEGDPAGAGGIRVRSLAGEAFWALAVWYGVAYLAGVVPWTPVDGARELAGLPWAGWLGGALEAVRGLLAKALPPA